MKIDQLTDEDRAQARAAEYEGYMLLPKAIRIIDALTAEVKRWKQNARASDGTARARGAELVKTEKLRASAVDYWVGQVCELRAENERLRTALQGSANTAEAEPHRPYAVLVDGCRVPLTNCLECGALGRADRAHYHTCEGRR